MKTKSFFIAILLCLAALSLTAQTIPGAPGYQLPVTVVGQKWYGTGVPTAALNYPSQPGDLYFDTTNKNLYWCAAPVTATIPIGGGPPACTTVTSGGWTLITGSSGSTTGTGSVVLATSPTITSPALVTPALWLTSTSCTSPPRIK